MPMPSPAERPDLYDFYDYKAKVVQAEYLIQVVPDEIKALLEAKHGKPFAVMAKEIEDQSRIDDQSSRAAAE